MDTPLHKVFPILTPFAKCAGKGKTSEHGEPLIADEEHNKEGGHSHAGGEPDTDPLNYLGFGMIAYRDLMFTMFWLYAVLSIIMIPVMVFYSA